MGFSKDIEDLQRRARAVGADAKATVPGEPESRPAPGPLAAVGTGGGDDPDVTPPEADD